MRRREFLAGSVAMLGLAVLGGCGQNEPESTVDDLAGLLETMPAVGSVNRKYIKMPGWLSGKVVSSDEQYETVEKGGYNNPFGSGKPLELDRVFLEDNLRFDAQPDGIRHRSYSTCGTEAFGRVVYMFMEDTYTNKDEMNNKLKNTKVALFDYRLKKIRDCTHLEYLKASEFFKKGLLSPEDWKRVLLKFTLDTLTENPGRHVGAWDSGSTVCSEKDNTTTEALKWNHYFVVERNDAVNGKVTKDKYRMVVHE